MKSPLLWLLLSALSLGARESSSLTKFISAFSRDFTRVDHKSLVKDNAVRFPLKLKGTLDDSPEIAASKKAFAAVLPKISGQSSGLNAANHDETEAEYLAAFVRAGKTPEDAGEATRRVGNLVFKKIGKKWQLVQVYVNDDVIDSINKTRE